ncbi:MAG TPA: hypothetical protein DEA08_36620, partial [Planctomycetes bacterium]|nr:hypothetical protein [Planctomycetota bacterium]
EEDDDDDDEGSGDLSEQIKQLCGGGFAVGVPLEPAADEGSPTGQAPGKPAKDETPRAPKSQACWEALLGRIGALAYRATSAGFNEAERGALCKVLEAWAESPWCELEPGRYRRLKVTWHGLPELGFAWPTNSAGDSDPQQILVEHEGSRYFVRTSAFDADHDPRVEAWVVERAASPGQFHDLPGWDVDEVEDLSTGWGSRAELRELLASWRGQEARAALPEAAEALAEGAGLSTAQAGLVLLGLPGHRSYEKNFLPKEARTALKLKVNEAATAKDALRELTPQQRSALLCSALPLAAQRNADPVEVGRRLGAGWASLLGERVAVPDEVIGLIDKELRINRGAQRLCQELLSPGSVEDLWPSVEESEDVANGDGHLRVMQDVVRLVPFLFERLPVGDPVRAGLPTLLARARELLSDPGLVFRTGDPFYNEYEEQKTEKIDAFLGQFSGQPFERKGKRDQALTGVDDGVLIAVRTTSTWDPVRVFWRPAAWRERQDHPQLPQLDAYMAERIWRGPTAYEAAQLILGEDLAAFAARIEDTPVPAGGYEANPLHSVPELVAEVARARSLSEDGAALYLQLLTLAAPTTRWVREANDWGAARYKAAAAELVGAELVLEAKRARAGRDHFLPGGWEELDSPDKPLEAWNLPLFGLKRDPEGGKPKRPLQTVLARQPLHQLFARAWERVAGGDEPRFTQMG